MLCSIEWRNLVLMQYNDQWRHHRRWYRAAFESKAVVDGYRPTQTAQAHRLLADLLRSPQDFMLHVKKCVCAAIYLYLGGSAPLMGARTQVCGGDHHGHRVWRLCGVA